MPLHKINDDSRLYVIACGGGFTCLGFDYAERQIAAVAAWLSSNGQPLPDMPSGDIGTAERFAYHESLMAAGQRFNASSGKRCDADLIPQLKGLEGRRVEIVEPDGDKRRFYVGRSSGWMPCHLEIARSNSTGGPAAYVPPGSSVRVLPMPLQRR